MVRLVFHGSVYVQILRGRLALIIENFKAYLLALSQIGKAGLPDRREVNKHLRSTGVRFYESIAFCRIKRLNGACSHHFGPRIVGLPDHSPEFAVQQSAAVPENARIALSRMFSTASCAKAAQKPGRAPEMVEYCPQLKHLANRFVESCAERNFVRQGTPCQSFVTDISTRTRGANVSAQPAT
jgi:hypothetical protein